MKSLLYFFFLSGVLCFSACKNDEAHPDTEYHILIQSPGANSVKNVGETLNIKVEFEEHNGGTVHHINVRIYNKSNGTDVYNKPDEAHVHKTASYIYEDNFTLNVAAGDYVLEAKVWGHDDGVAEKTESVTFKVN